MKNIFNKPIYGNFHNHTIFSDGQLTIEELIELAIKEGREYIGISDHSQYCKDGVNEVELLNQLTKIDSLNELGKIQILKSLECEILPNGDLDLSDEYLKYLDYLIIAIHTHSDMIKKEMEKRLIEAIENPLSKILAHPSARIYKKKPEILVDMYKIIDACIENHVVIEINGDPDRIDLDPRYLKYAIDKGAIFSLDSDTHSYQGFYNINNSIKIASDYKIAPEQCLNTYSYNQLMPFLE